MLCGHASLLLPDGTAEGRTAAQQEQLGRASLSEYERSWLLPLCAVVNDEFDGRDMRWRAGSVAPETSPTLASRLTYRIGLAPHG